MKFKSIPVEFWLVLLFIVGCSSLLRVSPYFGSSIYYVRSEDNLGLHRFCGEGGSNGMVYTCKGGFIDLGHVRQAADSVKHCYSRVFDALKRRQNIVCVKFIEPDEYFTEIEYLAKDYDEDFLRKASIEISRFIAHRSLVWHECITYFGYSCMALFPETPSSFSWEDVYSDILGCHIGAEALLLGESSFDLNVSKLILEKLRSLEAMYGSYGNRAEDLVRGVWFSGGPYPFITMHKRNFNVGLDMEAVSPWLVRPICNKGEVRVYAPRKPSFQSLKTSYFIFVHSSQGKTIAKMIGNSNKLFLDESLIKAVNVIRRDAILKCGPDVENPYCSDTLKKWSMK